MTLQERTKITKRMQWIIPAMILCIIGDYCMGLEPKNSTAASFMISTGWLTIADWRIALSNIGGLIGTALYMIAVLPFIQELMLHVSRPVRWDSDHVTIQDDPTQDLFSEIVRADALNRVHYGLDFFDGSINRIAAYVIGSRSAQKCMTRALLEPRKTISELELAGQGYKVLGLIEEQKCMPWQAVYDEFCLRNNVPVGQDWMREIDVYEKEVTSKR